jgi:hypothetical protein
MLVHQFITATPPSTFRKTFQIHPKLQDEVPSDSLRLEKLKKLRLLPLQRSTIAGPPGLVDDAAAPRGAVAEEGL